MKQVNFILFFSLVLITTNESFAQESPQVGSKLTTYIQPYGGLLVQGALNSEQSGVAHKRGDFNAFGTNFDLVVDVKGKSENATGSIFGLTYGSIWKKNSRKLNAGLEFDLFYTNSKHDSKLANPNTEEVANINGANADSVIEFVEEHYGPGHHTFSNTMTMTSLNAAVNLTLSYSITPKISINTALGLGFSAITLRNAESLQTSPAAANPGYETTSDNGGGPVNHFNSQTKASSNTQILQFRLGTKLELTPKVALNIDARGVYRGESEFTFGSTKYTDHPPTDNWNYSIDGGIGFMLTAGLSISL